MEYFCDRCMTPLTTFDGATIGYVRATGRIDPVTNRDLVQIFCADCDHEKVRGV